VLQTLADMMQESGYCPTVREIGHRLGIRSSCTVQRHLDALERKGYLRRAPGKARRIRLLGQWADPNDDLRARIEAAWTLASEALAEADTRGRKPDQTSVLYAALGRICETLRPGGEFRMEVDRGSRAEG